MQILSSLKHLKYSILVVATVFYGCSTQTPTSSVSDDESAFESTATGDYLYEGNVRIVSEFKGRLNGPTPVYFEKHYDDRASVDYPWMEYHGLIVRAAGDEIKLAYEAKPSRDGQEGNLEKVTVFYKYPGEDEVLFVDSRINPNGGHPHAYATIKTRPEWEGVLEFWFEVETTTGAQYWDSRLGKNYGVYLVANQCTLLTFANVKDGVWPETQVVGEFKAGGALCLSYDEGRAYALGLTDVSYRGQTIKPQMSGWAEFFDANGNSINKGEFSLEKVGMPIPKNAAKVSLWFKNKMYSGREAWDSKYGENYNFSISR